MTTALTRQDSGLPARVLGDRVVGRLQVAEKALQHAITIQQVKVVADVAAAQKVFAQRQKLGDDVTSYAHKIKIHALAKLGELLKVVPKATGTKRPKGSKGSRGRVSNGGNSGNRHSESASYTDLGVDKRTASVAQQLADMPAAEVAAIADQEKTISSVRREQRAAEVRQAVSLPEAKFHVLYIDPPWAYNDKADAGSVQSGGAAHHYPTMTIEELCRLDVVALCEPNAVLFLWVTSPLLFECLPVIDAWGFTYKASFVWDKVKHNMGHYNSVRHEFLLICTRGAATPAAGTPLFDSVQSIERTTHSTKPEAFRAIIDALYPHGKRVELFARREVPAPWVGWGNEDPQ